jgi:hypothetical protein
MADLKAVGIGARDREQAGLDQLPIHPQAIRGNDHLNGPIRRLIV